MHFFVLLRLIISLLLNFRNEFISGQINVPIGLVKNYTLGFIGLDRLFDPIAVGSDQREHVRLVGQGAGSSERGDAHQVPPIVLVVVALQRTARVAMTCTRATGGRATGTDLCVCIEGESMSLEAFVGVHQRHWHLLQSFGYFPILSIPSPANRVALAPVDRLQLAPIRHTYFVEFVAKVCKVDCVVQLQ